MQRRVTEWVCLLAVVAAIVLVVALNRDPTTPRADAAGTGEVTQTPEGVDPGSTAQQATREKRQARKAAAAERLATLMEAHGCWTGEAPAGVVPTHAVVTLPGAEPALADADVGYGIWLDGDPGELHGFCP